MELAQVLGHVSQEQLPVLEGLCQAAQLELTARLRTGITPEDCGTAFLLGGAWLALAGLAGGTCTSGTRFTAGSVTIQEPDSSQHQERAAALRLQAETVMAPYLQDRGFVFQGVDG